MDGHLEGILEKIRKCLALSESNNENEAKLAAQRAAEMMEKYKITQADLHTDPNAVNFTVTESGLFHGKGLWHTTIARNAAYASDCQIYIRHAGTVGEEPGIHRKVVTVVGTADGISLATYLYTYIVRMLRHLSRIYCNEFYGSSNPGAHVRSSFLEGAADSVGQRLRDRKDEVRSEARASGVHCTALIVLDKEAKAVEEYMRNLGLRPGRRRRGHYGQAYEHGYEAGRQVVIRDAVKGNGSSGPKMIGGGRLA